MLAFLLRLLLAVLAVRFVWRWLAGPKRQALKPSQPRQPPARPRRPADPIVDAEFEDLGEKEHAP